MYFSRADDIVLDYKKHLSRYSSYGDLPQTTGGNLSQLYLLQR